MTKFYGIDLSKHNGAVDMKKIAGDGNKFVIIRAGYGKLESQKDPQFEQYYKDAKAKGLAVGVYWYSYALTNKDALAEAQTCYNIIKGKQFDMPIFIDMEDADGYKARQGMPSGATLSNICAVFCEYMAGKGYISGVYASESWMEHQLRNVSETGRYPLWCAKWGTNDGKLQQDLSAKYPLHQFTSAYTISGKRFDKSVCYFDYPVYIKEYCLNGYTKKEPTEADYKCMALDVYAGLYGTGEYRKTAITQAGYTYSKVQAVINDWYKISERVCLGKYGNGSDRILALKRLGYTDAEISVIQKIVNKMMKEGY